MPTTSISTVIPLYNKERHIAETLISVLAQSRPPDEIVVVDDGSTDGSAEAVRPFLTRGVKLVQQANKGESAARNAGIAAATSEYVAFLDADDLWHPSHVAVLQQLIEQFPHVGLLSTLHEIRFGGHVFLPRSPFTRGDMVLVDDFFGSMARGLSLVNSSTACAKREALVEIGGFPVGVRKGPDIITWIRLARRFGMAHAAEVTAVYNRDATHRVSLLRESEAPGSLLYLRDLIEHGDLRDTEEASVGVLFDKISFYCAAGMKRDGDVHGVKTIRALAIGLRRWKLAAALTSISMTPAFLLAIASRFRHRKIPG